MTFPVLVNYIGTEKKTDGKLTGWETRLHMTLRNAAAKWPNYHYQPPDHQCITYGLLSMADYSLEVGTLVIQQQLLFVSHIRLFQKLGRGNSITRPNSNSRRIRELVKLSPNPGSDIIHPNQALVLYTESGPLYTPVRL